MSPNQAKDMSPQMARLLADIQAFCALTGVAESTLGESAMNDKHVVRDIRERNRQLRFETEQKIRTYMTDTLANQWAA
jgi:hypothetical protein